MHKTTMRSAVLAVLTQVQELSGLPTEPLTDDTVPIGGLESFDSLTAVEATVMLEKVLGRKIKDGTPFISADGKRPLAIRAVVDRLAEMIVAQEAA